MLTTLLAVNVLCLGAALLLLTRLARPLAPEGNPEPFARILAEVAPPADPAAAQPEPVQDPPGGPPPPAGPVAEDAGAVAGLTLADRLAVTRHMLQGRGVEETASLVRVPPEAVRALYLQHARREGATC
jgi:hypothetical protein